MPSRTCRLLLLTITALLLSVSLTYSVQAADPTTSVHVTRYASDGTTALAETTVDYAWMESNLPVYGDGTTHYYHQGPVFEGDKWDPGETSNLKDKGAVMGTSLKDLCDLVGGMSPGERVMLCAVDGYCIEFDYANIYQPSDRQGQVVLCWYKGEEQGLDGQWGEGYPPHYYDALQLVFMAGTANAEGKYVFGNWDMHECLPEEAQHFYGELYPSTNGLSVKWIDEIRIYSDTAPPAPGGGDGSQTASQVEPWLVAVIAVAGLALVAAAVLGLRKWVKR